MAPRKRIHFVGRKRLNPASDYIREQEAKALELRRLEEAKFAAESNVPETEVKPA